MGTSIIYFLFHLLPLPSPEHVITASLSIPEHNSSGSCAIRGTAHCQYLVLQLRVPRWQPREYSADARHTKMDVPGFVDKTMDHQVLFPICCFINMGSVLSLLWTPCITIVSFANLKYMFANLLLHCLAFFIETYYRSSYSIPIYM